MDKTNESSALVKRAYLFLEDGEWDKAKEYSERILDEDPEDATGYIIALMAEREANKKDDLKLGNVPLRASKSYEKALRYGDEETVAFLKESDSSIIYKLAENEFKRASTGEDYDNARDLYDSIAGYQDSAQKSAEAAEHANECRYLVAKGLMASKNSADVKKAIEQFRALKKYKDSAELLGQCEQSVNGLALAERARKKKLVIAVAAGVAIMALIVGVWVGVTSAKNNERADAIASSFVGKKFEGENVDWGSGGDIVDRQGSLSSTITYKFKFHFLEDGKVTVDETISTKWSATGIYESKKPKNEEKSFSFDSEYRVECGSSGTKLIFGKDNSSDIEFDENGNPVCFGYEYQEGSVAECRVLG